MAVPFQEPPHGFIRLGVMVPPPAGEGVRGAPGNGHRVRVGNPAREFERFRNRRVRDADAPMQPGHLQAGLPPLVRVPGPEVFDEAPHRVLVRALMAEQPVADAMVLVDTIAKVEAVALGPDPLVMLAGVVDGVRLRFFFHNDTGNL